MEILSMEDNMWWIIIITVIVLLGVLIVNYTKKEDEKDKQNGVLYKEICVDYHGGFQDIQTSNEPHATIKVYKDNIDVFLINHNEHKVIPLNKLNDIRCTTIEEIQSQVSLGKLIVFGWLAFGMKGKKKSSPCALLSYYDDDNKERDVIFGTIWSEVMVQKIMEIKNNSNSIQST